MMNDLMGLWQRIVDWYHVNAGGYVPTLAPAASDDEVIAAETTIGVKLPEDVRASYRLHNGSYDTSVFPNGHYLFALAELVAKWKMFAEALRSGVFRPAEIETDEPFAQVWWYPSWIPITGNGGGGYHFIDLDPTEGGSIGQVIRFSNESGPLHVVAGTFSTWLKSFADDLDRGEYVYDQYDRSLTRISEQGAAQD